MPDEMPPRSSAWGRETEAESAQIIDRQRAALQQMSNMFFGGQHLISQWTQMHQDFFARAAERLSSVQEEGGTEAQRDRIGKIARENAGDYMEMMAKMAHEAAIVGDRIARLGSDGLMNAAANMGVGEGKARQADNAHSQSPGTAEPKR
ncbi:hypothetical protein SAMN05444161_3336 [Rhizobiales bacterium GAS191]|nr:hypothetical protein SAMN05519103_02457 [Rhizobiales bacterium GAS113]SEB77686.1 hypothetical protein SAMN05519104_0094 [Rhizobiales bacterium GAS188]SED49997.1 hypothetical protein SAMN05444161_3336 [Rhizobiales bacterium GAS191]